MILVVSRMKTFKAETKNAIPVVRVNCTSAMGTPSSAYALLVVPIALVQLTLTTGIALFVSALNVFIRDTTKFITYVFRMGFFLSPALYPADIVPDKFRPIYDLNPFVTLFDAYRAIVMHHSMPDWPSLGIVAGGSIVVLILGYLFFVRLQTSFAKLV